VIEKTYCCADDSVDEITIETLMLSEKLSRREDEKIARKSQISEMDVLG